MEKCIFKTDHKDTLNKTYVWGNSIEQISRFLLQRERGKERVWEERGDGNKKVTKYLMILGTVVNDFRCGDSIVIMFIKYVLVDIFGIIGGK